MSSISDRQNNPGRDSSEWRAVIQELLDSSNALSNAAPASTEAGDLTAEQGRLEDALIHPTIPVRYAVLLDLAGRLDTQTRIALIKNLLSSLDRRSIEDIVEFSRLELKAKDNALLPHRLKLKKDPRSKKAGLAHPRQYFVYIANNRYHSDIYIGSLFRVEEGYPLSYKVNKEGAIDFVPPHNTFILSTQNSAKIIRLIQIIPPEPEFPVQSGLDSATVPAFILVEYLDTNLRAISQKKYQFPRCMYKGWELDQDAWKVSFLDPQQDKAIHDANVSLVSAPRTSKPIRRKDELVQLSEADQPAYCFYLNNPRKTSHVIERLRLFVALSETAMPQARWSLQNNQLSYQLMHARSQTLILQFEVDRRELTIPVSISVLVDWFKALGLAVSQFIDSSDLSGDDKAIGQQLLSQLSEPVSSPSKFLKIVFNFPESSWKDCKTKSVT